MAVGQLTAGRLSSDFNHQVSATASELAARLRVTFDATGRVTSISPSIDTFAAPEQAAVRLLSPDGAVLEATPAAPDFGPPTARAFQTAGYRIETRAVLLPGGTPVFVQYARPQSSLRQTLARLRLFLIIGVVGGTWVAFGTGLIVVGRTLRPITALTAASREIARTRDPTRSIPMPGTADEVAELAQTLQGMLSELADARAETEATIRRQREFVADASHELRTPLTSVLANLELLAEQLSGERAETALSALRSSRRMRRLVEDLLTLARLDIGHHAPHKPLSLSALAIDAAAELEPVSGDHVISLDAQPAALIGARDDLARVAINLIENALRHTPPGTHVLVSTRTLDGGYVELAVEDDGPGVAPDLQARLFERFIRGGGDSGGSFGLGLAMVHAVAEAHGGEVSLEPGASLGARFAVRLPGGMSDAHGPNERPD